MMVLSDKIRDALARARRADTERQKETNNVRQQKRAEEAFNSAAEVLFYLVDSDQSA